VVGGLVKNKSVPQGAATTIYGCVCPKVGTPGVRGAYLLDCREGVPDNADGRDESKAVRQALWKATEDQLNEALAKAGLNE
jgi:hypothetical protein